MSSVNVKKRITDLLQGTYAVNGYYGFPDLAANTDDIISDIYTSPTYSDIDRTNIAAWYAREDISILPEFPRRVAQLPSIFVFRTSDSEDPRGILGDYYAEDLESDDFNELITRGTYLLETVEVHVWAQGDGSRRDDLYLAMRELIIRGLDFLHIVGVEIPDWKNGKDGQFYREDLKPHVVHTGQASITYRVPLTWQETSAKIKQVQTNLKGYGGGVSTTDFSDDT